MHTPAVSSAALLGGLIAFGAVIPQASADLLDPKEIALVMESTLVDFDVTMIAIHESDATRRPTLATLNYTSSIEDDGWMGTLTGSVNGKPLEINYTGTITLIGGPTNQVDISYTSAWSFDGQNSTGSGSAIYNDPEFDFSIDLLNLEVSGSASVTYGVATFTLSGRKDIDDGELEVGGAVSVVDLPVLDVSLATAEISFFLNQFTGEYESSLTGTVLNFVEIFDETINEGDFTGDGNTMVITTESQVIPEPSAVGFLGLGLITLLGAVRRPRCQRRW